MSNHIRAHCPGGTFFFTVRLNDRSSDLLVREKDRLRRATKVNMTRHPFCIDAICILPGAIHTLWTLPPGDGDCARRWSMLKSCFARGLSQPPNSGAPVPRHDTLFFKNAQTHRLNAAVDRACLGNIGCTNSYAAVVAVVFLVYVPRRVGPPVPTASRHRASAATGLPGLKVHENQIRVNYLQFHYCPERVLTTQRCSFVSCVVAKANGF